MVLASRRAWLVLAVIAFNLTRAAAAATAAGTAMAKATTATIRRKLITIPARIASSARRLTLHLPTNWPWQHAWTQLFIRTSGPPTPRPPDKQPATARQRPTWNTPTSRPGDQPRPPSPTVTTPVTNPTPGPIGGSRLSSTDADVAEVGRGVFGDRSDLTPGQRRGAAGLVLRRLQEV